MEKIYELINICDELNRKDLSDLLQDLLSEIKEVLEEVDDEDYSDCDASSEEEEEEHLEESNYKVKIDSEGFWSFEFSDDEA